MRTDADPIEAFPCSCGAILKPPICGNPSCNHNTQAVPLLCPECGAVHRACWGRGQRTVIEATIPDTSKAQPDARPKPINQLFYGGRGPYD